MNNKNIVVCELANYAQPFSGNYMASLLDMENKFTSGNSNNKIIYAFYENSKKCKWIKEMQHTNKTIFFLKSKYILGFLQIKNIINEYNVNILHTHYTIPVIMFFFIKIFFPKIRIIAHFHNLLSGIYGPDVYKKYFISKLKKYLYNRNIIDTFCGCSEAVYNDLVNCGINRKKCIYIDNCIDFSRLDNIPNENKYENFIKNKKVLMITGYFFYTKGVDIAIQAIKDIADKNKIILMIVCHDKNSALKEIYSIFRFIPKWIIIVPTIENIATYLRISYTYLTPSREEGFSYTMLEAIYCETLVIRSNLPSMDRNLPNDFVVPVNDITALRQCIESVLALTDSEKRNIVSEQKKYIIQNWNIDIWSNKIINLYIENLNK